MNSKKKLLALISVLLFAISCILFAETNIRYFFASIVYGNQGSHNTDIIFSKKSGFYQKEFELQIYAPTKEVYYTLDGTDPDENSIKYEKPIIIKDASENPNAYSSRTDVTARFDEEAIEKNCGDREEEPCYIVPKDKVDKCNVVKVVYYDRTGVRSDIEEQVYFVGYDEKTGYNEMNVISITTDPENLFDFENGIYVLGNIYEEFQKNGMEEDYWAKEYWNHWDANYHQRGSEWERESSIKIFDKDKELVLSQNAGIRIQGGGSRGFLPKSLNIYAREEYGQNKLYYDFFGTGYYPKRVTLSNGGDDYYTKIKDRLVSELAHECNIVTMNYEPYILFLNGEYWGVYHLTEKYDAQFIENYYGVARGTVIDDIIMIKNDKVETGVEADWYVSYSEMKDFVLNHDMEKQENYQKACELIDMESFIDYFAVLGYVARCGDWPDSNFALWRSRNVSEKPYEDGKWRWMLFDVNSSSMGYGMIEQDLIGALRASSGLFDSLCANESFKKAFTDRLIELADTIYEKEYVNQKITEYVESMEAPMEKYYQRFFGTSNERFYECIEEIREFFNQRRPYVMDSIKNNFGEEYLGEKQ